VRIAEAIGTPTPRRLVSSSIRVRSPRPARTARETAAIREAELVRPQVLRPRALPPAHPFEFVAREGAPRPDTGEVAHERRGDRILLAHERPSEHGLQRDTRHPAKRHRDTVADPADVRA
jgi:hypothetical protein